MTWKHPQYALTAVLAIMGSPEGSMGFHMRPSMITRPCCHVHKGAVALHGESPGSQEPTVMKMSDRVLVEELKEGTFGDLVTPESFVESPPPSLDIPSKEESVADPIEDLGRRLQAMDLNALINTVGMVVLVIAVLSKLGSVDSGMMRGWTAAEMAYRIPLDNWVSYSAVLEREPVGTKAITSATVYTIGDFISQRTEGASMGEIDRPRLLRSLLAGLIGHGPLSHIWYDWSEGVFNDVLHWTEWWSFFPKVILDQATWGPFWNNTYILLLGLMKLESWTTIFGDMKRTTIPLLISGLKLWPLAHCVTYGLVPVENRLLWVDIVEILWVTILATQASGNGVQATEETVSPDGEEHR